ncbi:hypothetical protein HN747_00245 [archaeon]|nr:hypothetical protein [archaeon]
MATVSINYVPEEMHLRMVRLKGYEKRPERRYFVASPISRDDGRCDHIYLIEGELQEGQEAMSIAYGENPIHHQRAINRTRKGQGIDVPFLRDIEGHVLVNLTA